MKLLAVFILAVLVAVVAAFPADPAVPVEEGPAVPIDGEVPPEGADLTSSEWRHGGRRGGYGGHRRGGYGGYRGGYGGHRGGYYRPYHG